MISIARLQSFLRQSAVKQYELVRLGSFSLFFHPTDSLPYFNYAIPDEPIFEISPALMSALRDEFALRGRQARFEFVEAFAPDLAAALRAHQFVEEARQQGMLCMPDQARTLARAKEIIIEQLTNTSPVEHARLFLDVQHQGFGEQDGGEASDREAQELLDRLHGGKAFLARWDGQPVGAAMLTTPVDDLTELVGVATPAAFRRRGIASALVCEALRSAFADGVEAVYLTAADERAGQIYERAGFRACATMLAYCVPDPGR